MATTETTPSTTATRSDGKSGHGNQQQPLSQQALLYMALLALQFGLQPILARKYTSPDVCKSTVLMVQEIVKFCIALTILQMSGSTKAALEGWTISSWVSVAVVPAALYSVQNMCSLLAYQNLDALTFNVLNQTKTLSAALCVYFLMGRKQSKLQICALLLLLVSALVMEKIITLEWFYGIFITGIKSSSSNDSNDTNDASKISNETSNDPNETTNWDTKHFTHGVVPIFMASFISGLAGAITQKNLQQVPGSGNRRRRNAYVFSMELCVCSVILMTCSLWVSPDGQQIQQYGFFHGWTYQTLIPIIVNSIGGILVGLVTQHAGSVRKGFALIFGIFLSGVVQELLLSNDSDSGGHVSKEQVVGGSLAALSLWMHATNPPTTVVVSSKKGKEKSKTE